MRYVLIEKRKQKMKTTKTLTQKETVLNTLQVLKQSIFTTIIFGILFAAMLVFMAGCSDDSTITNNNGSGSGSDNVSMSVKTDETVLDNPAVLVITEAKALITELELETEPSSVSQHIRITPFVINFNMSGTVVQSASGNIPAGSYSKMKFKIHKPEDTEPIPDPEFRTGTSGNQRYSFIIKGTYNGTSFVFRSRRSTDLIINLTGNMNLQQTAKNITVIVNPLVWFNNGSLNPADPNNEDAIDDNLKNAFIKAFVDDNKDGIPDNN